MILLIWHLSNWVFFARCFGIFTNQRYDGNISECWLCGMAMMIRCSGLTISFFFQTSLCGDGVVCYRNYHMTWGINTHTPSIGWVPSGHQGFDEETCVKQFCHEWCKVCATRMECLNQHSDSTQWGSFSKTLATVGFSNGFNKIYIYNYIYIYISSGKLT